MAAAAAAAAARPLGLRLSPRIVTGFAHTPSRTIAAVVRPRQFAFAGPATFTFQQHRTFFGFGSSPAPAKAAAPVDVEELTSTPKFEGIIADAAPPPPVDLDLLAGEAPATSEVTSAATASETVAAVAENAPIYIGYLKELGLSSLFPPGLVQSGIEAIAVTTGMPWYASIICATVAIRVAFFPLVVKTQRFAARMQNIKHLTDPVNAEITEARADKNMAKQMEATRRLQKIYKDHGINPLTSLLGLAQVPVFISFFLGIRDMCNLPVPSFRTGGAYWFTDLTVEDPTQILPMLATAGIITSFGAASATGATPVSTPLIIGISVVSLLAYGVTKSFPMGIFIYWVTSSVLTIIQTLVLQNNAIRAVLNIPPITRPASSSTTTSGSLSTLGSVKLLQSAKAQQKNIEAAKRIKASSQAAQPRKRS